MPEAVDVPVVDVPVVDEQTKKAGAVAAAAAAAAAKLEEKRRAAFNTVQLQEDISMILALKDVIDPETGQTDPDLQAAFTAYMNNKPDAFMAAVLRSKFYRNNNALARKRAQARLSQEGVWKQDLAEFIAEQKNRLIGVGAKWNTAIEDQLKKIYNMGVGDDNYLDDILLTAGVIGELGGSTLGSITALKTYAGSFGVSSLLDSNYWNSKSKGIFGKDVTTEEIQKEIRDLAVSTFPAYADGLNNGVSLAAQGSSVIQTFAKFLEKDPDTLSFDNPDIRKVMQYVDPKTGQPARVPQWRVEQIVKRSDEWPLTNNARDTIDSLSLRVLQDMGLA